MVLYRVYLGIKFNISLLYIIERFFKIIDTRRAHVSSKISKEFCCKRERKKKGKETIYAGLILHAIKGEGTRREKEEKAESRSGPRRSDTRNQFRRCRYFEPLFTIESNSTG